MRKRFFSFLIVMAVVAALVCLPSLNTVSADSRVARIVAHDIFTGQTADLSPATTLTSPSGGADYRVSVYATKTSGPVAGAVTVDYTDDAGVQQSTVGISGVSQKTFVVHAASSTTLSVSTLNTQTGGSTQTYNLSVVIEEL